jgi:TatD DNase family protein
MYVILLLLMVHLIGSQLALAKKYHLPLFLHSRSAHDDFVQILREEGFGEDGGRAVGGQGGVVHSFTGSAQDAVDYVRARDLPL